MTRPIKFRAWDDQDEKMRHDIGVYDGRILTYNDKVDLYSELSKKRYAAMQFTGLLDKNGKEIYEGDIIECIYIDGAQKERTKIEMKPFKFFGGEEGCMGSGVLLGYPFSSYWELCEVIGNIYENPELLK